uniref:Fibrillin-1-like n=1 Tax=Dermatophagoides pteronyssinus TaxID=6956 RepID=A0A6P6XQQ4_DERPT|nr:fibrillin-1-like [Dermatophagoides pteronyssinus]
MFLQMMSLKRIDILPIICLIIGLYLIFIVVEAGDECCKTGQIFSGRNECHMIPNINNVGVDRIHCLLQTTYCCLESTEQNFCHQIGLNFIKNRFIQDYLKGIVHQQNDGQTIKIYTDEFWSLLQSLYQCHMIDKNHSDEAFCCVGCVLGFASAIQRISEWNPTQVVHKMIHINIEEWCSNMNDNNVDMNNIGNLTRNFSNQTSKQKTYNNAASETCCQETVKAINSSIRWCHLRPAPCAHRCHESNDGSNNHIKCSCWEGYHLDDDQKSCIDNDECQESTHGCNIAYEMCSNTEGGYQCLPKMTDGLVQPDIIGNHDECSYGFYFNYSYNQCKDIDECAQGTHDCNHRYQVCMNIPGSWKCIQVGLECPKGFRRLGASTDFDTGCRDIDECREGINNCDYLNENCENNIGSFSCEEKPNITLRMISTHNTSSVFLAPISELLIKNKTEEYSPASLCPKGYHYIRFSASCEDIDECRIGQHNCDLSWNICVNLPGSYKCRPNIVKQTSNIIADFDDNDNGTDSNVNYYEFNNDTNYLNQNERKKINNYSLANMPVVCMEGYSRNPILNICDDIDECRRTLGPCPSNAFCHNTLGSYDCHCKAGFIKNQQTNKCDDIDECEQKLSHCPSTMRCVNTIGSFECIHQQQTSTRRNNFRKHQQCLDRQIFDPNQNKCVMNEKEKETSDSTSENLRSISRFTKPKIPDQMANNVEVDLNKLFSSDKKIQNSNVDQHVTKPNIQQLDRCKFGERMIKGECKAVVCGQGFFYNETEKRCQDMNECLEYSPCKIDEKCTNTIGSYRCSRKCNSGYRMSLNGHSCEDIDECAERSYSCPSNRICKNRLGSYSCECQNGFVSTRDGTCQDIDECEQGDELLCEYPETQRCINTIGSYHCECREGYRQVSDDKSIISPSSLIITNMDDEHNNMNYNNIKCIDVDECQNRTLNKCHHLCQNYIGSYKCSCISGYKLDNDGFSCIDEDECKMFKTSLNHVDEYDDHMNDNDDFNDIIDIEEQSSLCYYKCVNVPGSFRCICPPGYESLREGSICRDIDECEQQDEVCNDNEFCLNIRGSYRCITITCPDGYFFEMKNKKCLRHQDGVMGFRDLSKPISYSFNYLSIISNIRIPKSLEYFDLVSLGGKVFAIPGVKYSLTLNSARPSRNGVRPARREDFILRRPRSDQIIVALIEPLQGPQDVDLELTISLYPDDKFSGMSKALIYIIVSEYSF